MRNDEEGTIQIGDVTLSLAEAEQTLAAIREGKVDAVVVEGLTGHEVFTFRDPSHPFRLLIETMSEGAMLTSTEGIICYQNPRFSEMVGMEANALQGRALADLVSRQQRPGLEDLLARAHTGPPARGNFEFVAADGRPIVVQLSVSRACLADVEVYCVVATDLTEQRRQEELYRAARLEIEARDRLFAVAAHELRNPLGVLELQAQLLGTLLDTSRDGTRVPLDRAQQMVSKVRQQGRRLAQLVTNLLDVESIGRGRLHLAREEIDLADAVRAALDLSREEVQRAGSSVALDLQSMTGCWDRVRIEQVIENLISNAAKYGLGRPIRVVVTGDEKVACIAVEDQGRGIPKEARERIFRPYERIAHGQAVPGLGIGLYVIAEIVKAHGGSISVQERPGGGSRFLVELPRANPT